MDQLVGTRREVGQCRIIATEQRGVYLHWGLTLGWGGNTLYNIGRNTPRHTHAENIKL